MWSTWQARNPCRHVFCMQRNVVLSKRRIIIFLRYKVFCKCDRHARKYQNNRSSNSNVVMEQFCELITKPFCDAKNSNQNNFVRRKIDWEEVSRTWRTPVSLHSSTSKVNYKNNQIWIKNVIKFYFSVYVYFLFSVIVYFTEGKLLGVTP